MVMDDVGDSSFYESAGFCFEYFHYSSLVLSGGSRYSAC